MLLDILCFLICYLCLLGVSAFVAARSFVDIDQAFSC